MCNAIELHENVQLICTWYKIHEFLHEGVQLICVACFRATHLHQNLHGICKEHVRNLQENLLSSIPRYIRQKNPHINKKIHSRQKLSRALIELPT